MKKWIDILHCPQCKSDFIYHEEKIVCLKENHSYPVVDGIPIFQNNQHVSWDVNIAHEKWNQFYKNVDWEKGKDQYEKYNLSYIYKHLVFSSSDVFLEIGGGPSYLSFDLSDKVNKVVVVDFDLDILRVAKKYFEKNGREAFFVCANVNSLPFRDNIFDISAGLGVIEHTQKVWLTIKELYRVTRKNGYTFQTVPFFSFMTIFNNSLRYGSFTPSKVLNKCISFLHIKMFKCRRMAYGYEELYTKRSLKKYFTCANFKDIIINFYDYNQTLLKKRKVMNCFFYYLIRLKIMHFMPFADIVYIKAYKDI